MKRMTLFVHHTGRAIRHLALLAIVAAAMAGAFVPAGRAQTLNDIMERKKIVVGVLVDFPPFGFLNGDQQPDGFDVDFARLLAKYMGVDVQIVPVDGANRVPFLISKRVDILVASLGITPERAKQVMFTIPYAATVSEVVALKTTKIQSVSDLSGLRIAAARASTNDLFISQAAPKDAIIMRFEGDSVATQALLSGQVEALAETNTMVNALFKEHPELKLEVKLILRSQANAIAVRRDAFELHQWLNSFIYYVKANGELNAMYTKWIGGPLPDLPVF